MQEPLTQNEAIETFLGLGTAIMNNDKVGREMLYEELSADDLKRVLRWSVRFFLDVFVALNIMNGLNPVEAWQNFALSLAKQIAEENNEDQND